MSSMRAQSTVARRPVSSPREANFAVIPWRYAAAARACSAPAAASRGPASRTPPSASTRSRMPARPRPGAGCASGDGPAPPSRTSTSSAVASHAEADDGRPSPAACFIALVSPSWTTRYAPSLYLRGDVDAVRERRVVEPQPGGPRLVEQAHRGRAAVASSAGAARRGARARPAPRVRRRGCRRSAAGASGASMPARARLDHHHGQVVGDDVVQLAGDPRALAPHGHSASASCSASSSRLRSASAATSCAARADARARRPTARASRARRHDRAVPRSPAPPRSIATHERRPRRSASSAPQPGAATARRGERQDLNHRRPRPAGGCAARTPGRLARSRLKLPAVRRHALARRGERGASASPSRRGPRARARPACSAARRDRAPRERLEGVLDHAIGGQLDAGRQRPALAAGHELEPSARARRAAPRAAASVGCGVVSELVAAQHAEHLAHLVERLAALALDRPRTPRARRAGGGAGELDHRAQRLAARSTSRSAAIARGRPRRPARALLPRVLRQLARALGELRGHAAARAARARPVHQTPAHSGRTKSGTGGRAPGRCNRSTTMPGE